MSKPEQKTEISKIEIKVAGETLRLTLEQAKELQEILNETFPKSQPFNVPIIVDRPYPVYPRPWWNQWEITCSDTNEATMCLALK